jgi:hypothetical protein
VLAKLAAFRSQQLTSVCNRIPIPGSSLVVALHTHKRFESVSMASLETDARDHQYKTWLSKFEYVPAKANHPTRKAR